MVDGSLGLFGQGYNMKYYQVPSLTHCVFQVSCAFFTFALAVSSVNGGASDIVII